MVSLETLLHWIPWGRKDTKLELDQEKLVSVPDTSTSPKSLKNLPVDSILVPVLFAYDAAVVLEKPQLLQWRGERTGYPQDHPRVLAYQRLSKAGVVPALRWNEGMLAPSHEPEKYLPAVVGMAERALDVLLPQVERIGFPANEILHGRVEEIREKGTAYLIQSLKLEVTHIQCQIKVLASGAVVHLDGQVTLPSQLVLPTRKQLEQSYAAFEEASQAFHSLLDPQIHPHLRADFETYSRAYTQIYDSISGRVRHMENELTHNNQLEHIAQTVGTRYLTSKVPLLERVQRFKEVEDALKEGYRVAGEQRYVVRGKSGIDVAMTRRKGVLLREIEHWLGGMYATLEGVVADDDGSADIRDRVGKSRTEVYLMIEYAESFEKNARFRAEADRKFSEYDRDLAIETLDVTASCSADLFRQFGSIKRLEIFRVESGIPTDALYDKDRRVIDYDRLLGLTPPGTFPRFVDHSPDQQLGV